MSEAYTSVGTLSDEKNVVLDQPTVIVEPLPDRGDQVSWLDTLRAIRQTLRESGYLSYTRDEIDQHIRSERDAWRD